MSWEEFEIKNHGTFSLSFQMLIHLFALLIKGRGGGGGERKFCAKSLAAKKYFIFQFYLFTKIGFSRKQTRQKSTYIFFGEEKFGKIIQANQKINHLARPIKDGY